MKVLLAALFLLTTATARADGDAPIPAAKVPGDTIEVAPESGTGLFERVRDAHTRAVQKGTVTAKQG